MTFDDFVKTFGKADVVMADERFVDTKTVLATNLSLTVNALEYNLEEDGGLAYVHEIAREGFEEDSVVTSKNGIEAFDQNSSKHVRFLFFTVTPMEVEN